MTIKSRDHSGLARLLSLVVGGLMLCATTAPVLAQSSWEAEWQELQAKAKKEGKLSVALGGSSSRDLRPIYQEFEKKFGVRVALGGGQGSLVTSRLLSERASGVYALDLIQIGIGSVNEVLLPNDVLDPIPPQFLLPEVKDESAWLDGHHWWGDPKTKQYVFCYALPQGDTGIAINTKLVNPDDINTYWDVLDSKYDGLRTSGDMGLSVGAHTVATMWMMVGKDWLRRWITEAKPQISSDTDVMMNWLIQGRYGIAMFMGGRGEMSQLDDLQKKGAPVMRMTKIMKEGADANPGSSGNFALLKNAPNPNATKLFINWFLSKEGQLYMQTRFSAGDSLRIDIPKDMVDPSYRREDGVTYRVLTTELEYQNVLKESTQYVEELKRSMKK